MYLSTSNCLELSIHFLLWIYFHVCVMEISTLYACFGPSCLLSGNLIGESRSYQGHMISPPLSSLSVCLSDIRESCVCKKGTKWSSFPFTMKTLRFLHFLSQVCCCTVLVFVEWPQISHDAKLRKWCCWIQISDVSCLPRLHIAFNNSLGMIIIKQWKHRVCALCVWNRLWYFSCCKATTLFQQSGPTHFEWISNQISLEKSTRVTALLCVSTTETKVK